MKNFYTILLVFCCVSCTQIQPKPDAFAHIKDEKAKAILQKSIEHYGGLEKWNSIKELHYQKDFTLYDADGEVEKTFEQKHDYQYQPDVINIQSKENGAFVHTTLKDGKYTRKSSNQTIDDKQAKLAKAVNASLYVIGIPFKLLDANAKISYEGEEHLMDGEAVDVLRVEYDATKFKNHSSTEIWKYYFDKKEGKIVKNWVQTSDHSNIVENISFERVGGILFNKKRKSWRLDSLGHKDYLRAEYLYHNYSVK